MSTITYERIKVVGGFGVVAINELEFNIEANCHAKAKLKGRVDKKKFLEMDKGSLERHIVKILILEEDGSEPRQPIFSGYPKQITFWEEANFCHISLEVSSGTILLDREKKSRSFQDISMNYSDIIKKAVKDISGASVICSKGNEIKSTKPLIQYMETNWDFILRLASHMKEMVYPEVRQPLPRFWFGMPQSVKKAKFSEVRYESGISSRYYELGGETSGLKQGDFIYYIVNSTKDYDIGDSTVFMGKQLRICKKSAKLIRGELLFTYVLGMDSLVSLRRRYNPVFAGMSILGKVLEVKGETIKIHLDIDEKQESGTAYSYEWVPDTGSTMYCMPKVGTTVSLYFSNEEESSARAVNCIRMNGASCPNMADSNKKSLTTEYGKQMYLDSTSLGFLEESSGMQLKMEDNAAIFMKSSKKITLTALGKIKIAGKKISVNTPVEMKILRKG